MHDEGITMPTETIAPAPARIGERRAFPAALAVGSVQRGPTADELRAIRLALFNRGRAVLRAERRAAWA